MAKAPKTSIKVNIKAIVKFCGNSFASLLFGCLLFCTLFSADAQTGSGWQDIPTGNVHVSPINFKDKDGKLFYISGQRVYEVVFGTNAISSVLSGYPDIPGGANNTQYVAASTPISAAFDAQGALYVLYRTHSRNTETITSNATLNVIIYESDKSIRTERVIIPALKNNSGSNEKYLPSNALVTTTSGVKLFLKEENTIVQYSGANFETKTTIFNGPFGEFFAENLKGTNNTPLTETHFFLSDDGGTGNLTMRILANNGNALGSPVTVQNSGFTGSSFKLFQSIHGSNGDNKLFLTYQVISPRQIINFQGFLTNDNPFSKCCAAPIKGLIISKSGSTYTFKDIPAGITSSKNYFAELDKYDRLWVMGGYYSTVGTGFVTNNTKLLYYSGSSWKRFRNYSAGNSPSYFGVPESTPNFAFWTEPNDEGSGFEKSTAFSVFTNSNKEVFFSNGSKTRQFNYGGGVEILTTAIVNPHSPTWYGPNNVGKFKNEIIAKVTLSDPIVLPNSFTTAPSIKLSTGTSSVTGVFLDPATNADLYTGFTSDRLTEQLFFKATVLAGNDDFGVPNTIGGYDIIHKYGPSVQAGNVFHLRLGQKGQTGVENFTQLEAGFNRTVKFGNFPGSWRKSSLSYYIDIDRPRITSVKVARPVECKYVDAYNNPCTAGTVGCMLTCQEVRGNALIPGDKIAIRIDFDQQVKLAANGTFTATLNIGNFSVDGLTHTTSTTLTGTSANITPSGIGNGWQLIYTIQERDFVLGGGNIALTSFSMSEESVLDFYHEAKIDLYNINSLQSHTSDLIIRPDVPKIIDLTAAQGNDGTYPTSGATIIPRFIFNYPLQIRLKNGFTPSSAYYEITYDNGFTQRHYWGGRFITAFDVRPGTYLSSTYQTVDHWAINTNYVQQYKATGDTRDLTISTIKFVGLEAIDPGNSGNSLSMTNDGFVTIKGSHVKIESTGTPNQYRRVSAPITSFADNKAIVQQGALPTITSVTGTNGTYTSSGTITLTVTTSESVAISGTNSPTLVLNVKNSSGTQTKTAVYIGSDDLRPYASATSSNATRYLNFLLTVDDGDYTNGKLDAVALELPNGTTITDGTNNLALSIPTSGNLAATSAIYIDKSGPVITAITLNPTNTSATVQFNEALLSTQTLTANSFTLSIISGTVSLTSNVSTSATISGTTVIVGLPALTGTVLGTEQIQITPPSTLVDSRNFSYTETSLVRGTLSDQTAPAAPTIDLEDASDTGTSNTDNITKDKTPTLTVTGGAANFTVQFTLTNTTTSTTLSPSFSVNSSTSSVTFSELNDGVYTVSAVLVDPSGNTSASSSTLTLTIDSTAPSNQDAVIPATFYTIQSGSVSATVVSSGDITNRIWVAPAGTAVFSATATSTLNTDGTTTTVAVPSAEGEYKVYVEDAAGNVSAASNALIVRDLTLPSILSVTSTTANGEYGSGSNVNLTLTFAESVVLSGTLSITLNSGAQVSVSSLTSSNTISTTYTVGESDQTNDLSISSITVTAGTLSDLAGNTLSQSGTVSITAGANLADNKAIKIDNSAPTLTTVTATPTGTYKAGDVIKVILGFDDIVTLSGSGTISVTLNSGASITANSLTSSNTLSIDYVVQSTDNTNGLKLDLTGVTLTGTLTNAAGLATSSLVSTSIVSNISSNTAVYIDNSTPVISLTSSGPVNNRSSVNYSTTESLGTVYMVLASKTITNTSHITSLPDREYNQVTVNAGTGTISTTELVEGTYKLYHIDLAGNVGSSTATITVDNTAPFITLLEPANSTFGPSQTITVQMGEVGKLFVLSTTASSTASLTALIADVAESATATNTWNSLTISDATKNTSLEFNLTGLNTDGKHYLVGVDQAGNVTVIKEGLSFTLDATAPSYIFTSSATISKGGSITISSSEEGKIYLVSSSNSPLKESDILAYPSSQFDDIKMGVLSSGRYLPDGNISGSISTDIGLSDGSYKIYAVDKYGNLSLSTTTVTIGASGLKVVEAYIDINGTKYYPGDLIPLVNHESSHTAKLVFKFSEKFRIGFVQNVSNSSKLDVISKTFSRNSLGTNFYNYKYKYYGGLKFYGHLRTNTSSTFPSGVNWNTSSSGIERTVEGDQYHTAFTVPKVYEGAADGLNPTFQNGLDDTNKSVKLLTNSSMTQFNNLAPLGLFVSTIPSIAFSEQRFSDFTGTYLAESSSARLEIPLTMSTLKNGGNSFSSYFKFQTSFAATPSTTNSASTISGNLVSGTNLNVQRISTILDGSNGIFLDNKNVTYSGFDPISGSYNTKSLGVQSEGTSNQPILSEMTSLSQKTYVIVRKVDDPYSWNFSNENDILPPTINFSSSASDNRFEKGNSSLLNIEINEPGKGYLVNTGNSQYTNALSNLTTLKSISISTFNLPSGTLSTTFNIQELDGGTYKIIGVDLFGNISQPSTSTLSIVSPPTGTLISSERQGPSTSVSVQSTAIGSAALVLTSATVSSVASITALTSSQAATISITTANVNTPLPLSGLNGEYKLYVWDASGNLSTGSFNSVFVDGIAPTPRLTTTGTVNNNTTISVSSSEIGELYLVHSSVASPTVADILNADLSKFNSLSATSTSTVQLSTAGLIDGTYNLYAVDEAGNLSPPSSNLSPPYNNSITIDGTAPVLTSLSATPSSGSFKAGDVINFVLTFDSPITYSGTMSMTLSNGVGLSSSTTSSTTITVPYTISSGQDATALTVSSIYIISASPVQDLAANALSGSISATTNAIGNINIDTQAPTITLSTSGTISPTQTISFTSSETGTAYFATSNTYTNTAQLIASSGVYSATINAVGANTISATAITPNTIVYLYVTDQSGNTSVLSNTSIVVDSNSPTATLSTTSTINDATEVSVQSTELGTAYLVNTSTLSVTSLTDITTAPDSKWNSVPISTINTSTSLSTSGLISGTYQVYAVDNVGNLSVASTASVTIDTEEPYVTSVTAGTSSATLTAGQTASITVNFSEPVTFSNGATLTLQLNVGRSLTFTSTNAGGLSATATYTVQDGDYTTDLDNAAVEYLVDGDLKDAAGNDFISSNLTGTRLAVNSNIVVDASKPVPVLISEGSFNPSQSVSLTVDKTSTTVYLVLDDNTYSSVSSITALSDDSYNTIANVSATVTSTIQLSTLKSGTYVLYAIDASGNFSAKSNNSIIVDADNPVVELQTLGIIKNTEALEFTVSEASTVYIVPSTTLTTTTSTAIAAAVLSTTTTNESGTVSVTITSVPDGTYKLFAVDTRNNSGVSSETFTVDSNAGTITLTSTGYKNLSDLLTFSASEFGTAYLIDATLDIASAVSSPTSYDARFNSIEVSSSSGTLTATVNTEISTTGLQNGTYKMILIDYAGNISPSSTNSITIDTEAAVVSVTSTNATDIYSGTETITIQSTESGIGYIVNSTAITELTSTALQSLTASPTLAKAVTIATANSDVSISLSGLEPGVYFIYAEDPAKNISSAATRKINIDLKSPLIQAVSTTAADGIYISGNTVPLKLYLSEAATLSGTLNLTLNTGETVQITSLTNSDVISTTYTVGGTASSTTDLTIQSISLSSGGTLKDEAQNATTSFSLASFVNLAASSDIVIDNTLPTVTLTDNQSDRKVKNGDVVGITATFSESMTSSPMLTIGSLGTYTMTSTDASTWTYSWTVSATTGVYSATVAGVDLAGNAYAGTSSLTYEVDNDAPSITNVTSSWGSALNITESAAGGTISLTTTGVEDGQVITATLTPGSSTYSATVTNNAAVITLSSLALTLSDGTYSMTFIVSDVAGNASGTQSMTFTVDRTVPQVLTSSNSWGSVLNIAESALSGVISITTTGASDGDNATLAIGGGSYTSTITSNTASFTVSATYLTSLVDGSTVSYTVVASDAAQNTSSTYSSTFTVDKVAPTLTLNGYSWGEVLNTNESAQSGTISFTTTAEDGQLVEVGLNGVSYTPSVTNATASLTLSSTVLTGLTSSSYSLTYKVADISGNESGTYSSTLLTDKSAPTVLSVSGTNGNYKLGAPIQLEVQFSEPVVITGVPKLALTTGGTLAANASYVSFNSTTNSGVFSYTVQIGDQTNSLEYASITALTLNGGTIKDVQGNDAVLDLPTLGNSNTLSSTSDIAIDGVAPAISTINASWIAATDGSSGKPPKALNITEKGLDQTIGVITTGVEDGQVATIRLVTTGYSKTYTGTILNNSLTVNVPRADLAPIVHGIDYQVFASAEDIAGNTTPLYNITFDADFTPPGIQLVHGQKTSANYNILDYVEKTYRNGQRLDIYLKMNDVSVTVSGSPYLMFDLGGTTKRADHNRLISNSGVKAFSYTIQPGDVDLDGISIPNGTHLFLNGGSMRDASSNFVTETALIFRDQDTRNLSKLKVNGALPVVTIANVSWGDTLNLTESSASGTISITTTDLEEGQVVQLSITNTATNQSNTYTSTITSGGAQIELDATTLTSYVDANTYSITAVASDLGGNASSVASVTFTVDRTVPQVLTSSNSWGSVLNIAESALSGVISITTTGASDGDNATLAIGGGSYTSTITSNTASFTVSATYLTSLVDGSTVSYTVVANDAAQNTSSTYSSTFTVDTKAPSITITSTLSRLAPGQQTTLTFTSSEPITNFDLNDITVSTGSVSDFTIVNSQDFTVKYTYPSITANDVTFSLLPGKVDDLVGNSNTLTSTLTLVLNSGPVGSPVPIIITQDDPDMVINLTNGISDPDGDPLNVENLQIVYTMSSGGSQYTTVNNQVLSDKFSKILSSQSLNGNELAINTSNSNFLSGTQTGKIEISYDISDGTYSLKVNNEIVITGKNDAPSGFDLTETKTFQVDSNGQKLKDIQGNDLTAEIKEDLPIYSQLVGIDSDLGDRITYILGSTDSLGRGKLEFNTTNGSYKYTPALHFYGDVFFEYFVEDLFGIRKGPYKVVIKIAESPDDDGIPTSLETIALNNDLDNDGVPDRKQANISNFPITSAAEFQAGKNWSNGIGSKPAISTMGSILIGDLSSDSLGITNPKYRLDPNAKLSNIGIVPKDTTNINLAFQSDLYKFSIIPAQGKQLLDLDNDASNGLQTRVVINLPVGINASTYLKSLANGQVIVFKDDQNLDTWDDGATLIDTDKDGLIDRIVVTITDNGRGDSDPTIGRISDPGGLGFVKPKLDDFTSKTLNEGQNTGTLLVDLNEKYSNKDFDLENDTLNYSFSSTTASTVLSALSINPKTGEIKVNERGAFDFEAFVNNNGVSIIEADVIISDKNLFSDTASIKIPLKNLDEIPTIVSNKEIDFMEKQKPEVIVVDMETLPDYQDLTSFIILAGKDANDFNLEPSTGVLRFNQSPEFSKKKTYKIDVNTIDVKGNSDIAEITINILNKNENPSDILLSKSSVEENLPLFTNVGIFNSKDEDEGDTFIYELVSGIGDSNNSSFKLVGDTLKTASTFDFENKRSYLIRVRVTDVGGLSYEKQFNIAIIDVNEDTDGDGIWDDLEKGPNLNSPIDTDKDGLPDYLDLDSDDDGIFDKDEAGPNPFKPLDSDGDGISDYREIDSDNDGYLDGYERNIDTDRDGIPDFQDLDSDGDGIEDKVEDNLDFGNIKDCDRDGIENRLDPDVCELILPQIITPNGDGLNDVLIIPGILRLQPNRLTIINRWGSVVFDQENYQNNWGGISFSGELPDGVYYYVVDFKGAKPTISNYVYLDRTGK